MEKKQKSYLTDNHGGKKMNGKIIAVCGGNGVGKSTICTNLATVLSEDKIVILFAPRTDYPSIQSFF